MLCKLALEDGTIFTGTAFGAPGTHTGEVVFNTALVGYQEVLTDPSYCGQLVAMTFPQMGNYGINPDDFESKGVYLSGFIVKALPRRPSNYRATLSLHEFLSQRGVLGIAGIDTRALTRRLRVQGAMRGALSTEVLDDLKLVQMARGTPQMAGADLTPQVTVREPGGWAQPLWTFTPRPRAAIRPDCHLVAIDCGAKHNILRHLVECGAAVSVVPADAEADQIRALRPDGIVVTNGPGDPAAVTKTIATLKQLLGEVPLLGICLGHQMLGLALGAETYKLRFGHHGINVPVLNKLTGHVEITSQNHGFAVDQAALERVGGQATHVNLNDQSLEGFIHADHQIVALQFHPEASPGPHDSAHVFRNFVERVRTRQPVTAIVT